METRVKKIDQRLQRLQALIQRLRAERRMAILHANHSNLKVSSCGVSSSRSPEPCRDESVVRLAAKSKIKGKYDFMDWNEAPDEALREYYQFLKALTEAGE